MFMDVYRQLAPRTDEDAERLRKRLENVARDVISKEIDGLREAGAVVESTVYIKKLGPEGVMLIDGQELRLRGVNPVPRLFRVEVLAFTPARKEFRIRMSVLRGNPPTPELETKPFWV